MEKHDIKRFAVIMGTLYITYDRDPNTIQIDAYFNAMLDLAIEQVESAARKWIQIGKFFPKPVELREIAQPDMTDYEAGQAWQLAVQYVSDQSRSITFTDKLINATIRRLGGRATFSRIGANELERFWRPRFLEEYKRLRTMERIPESLVAPLPSMLPKDHVIRDKTPISIGCDYTNHVPAIEYKPNGEVNNLITTMANQKRIQG